MGSGSRFKFGLLRGFGLGLHIDDFPFQVTISANLLFWFVSVGFGKAYDDER